MKRSTCLGAVVSVWLGSTTLVIGQSTIYWGGTTANWSNGTSWVGGIVPKNGNSGIIASGQAQAIYTNGLYDPVLGETPPASILIQSGGNLAFKAASLAGKPSMNNHNLVLDGGTVLADNMEYTSFQYDHDILVRRDSSFNWTGTRGWGAGSYTYALRLYGALQDFDATHIGVLTKTNTGALALFRANTPFTGGWNILGGVVLAMTNGALGSGAINVDNGGSVGWGFGGYSVTDTNLPSITIGSNSAFAASSGSFYLGAGRQFLAKNGSKISCPTDGASSYLFFDVTLDSGATLTIQRMRRQSLNFCNDFIGDKASKLDVLYPASGTEGGYYWYKTNNAFCGSLQFGYTQTVYSNGVFGTGPAEIKSSATVEVKGDLKLYNVFSGEGTLKPDTSKTLTLQPCYRNSILTDAGIAPGANGGLSIGTLTVSGHLSFTNLPAYDGVNHAYSQVRIRMQSDPQTGSGTGSILKVTGNLNGLTNTDLTVTTPAGLPPGTYTIITAANNLSTQVFHSVTYVGQSAAISYESGAVKLVYSAAGPLVANAETTNLTATSASFAGNLTSTGTAATTVFVYYGTTDGGTNAGNWANPPINLGVRGPGPFTAEVSGLLADTRYFYRCFASNAVDTLWAPSTASVMTPEDVSGYARRMKISFPGYDRDETLTNFPALVVLDESITGFKYSDFVSANGYDLRFSNANGSKTLKYEIDTWNPAAKSWVWVQLDALASNSFIWAYWGNAATAASSALYTTNGATWSERYLSVWHLNGTNTAGKTLDATTNRFHGTVTACTNAVGQIAGASSFYGAAANINVTGINYAGGVDANRNYTFYYWLSMTNMSLDARLIDITSGRLIMDVGMYGAGTATYHDGTWRPVAAGTNLNDGAWHHLVFVLNGSTLKGTIYKDGLAVGTNITYSARDIGGNSHMGSENDGAGTDYVGLMDEARIATVARSSNWVWACWMNQASNSVFSTAQVMSSAKGSLIILR